MGFLGLPSTVIAAAKPRNIRFAIGQFTSSKTWVQNSVRLRNPKVWKIVVVGESLQYCILTSSFIRHFL